MSPKTAYYFRWCIENDFQVYIKPESYYFKIAIRKGGITSNGKDFHYDRDTGMEYYSNERTGSVRYKSVDMALAKLHDVYKYLYEENTKRLSVRPSR
jgi:hypothetical protein